MWVKRGHPAATRKTVFVVLGLLLLVPGWAAASAVGNGQHKGHGKPTTTTPTSTGSSGGSTADTQPPTAPASLNVSGVTATSLSLAWTASSDNVGVAGYDVYLNSSKVATTTTPGYAFSGLACGTGYSLAVDARDAAGNQSAKTVLTGSTSACPLPVTTSVGCDLFASPTGSDSNPGSSSAPFLSAQKLADSLSAGQTGCLRAGTYAQGRLTLRRGGTSTARVTLTSYPGERARLTGGIVVIAPGANYVTLSNLGIDGAKVADDTLWVQANDATVTGVDLTNESTGKSCMIIGSNESWGGPTARVTIRGNRFHDCGNPADGNQDHAIYIENTSNSVITDNLFWGTSGYAIHLYPNAQNTRVTHNVIADNSRGVIFAGDSEYASSNNTVAYNVIADTSLDPNIRSFWGGVVGTGNSAHDNCLYNGNPNDVGTQTGFTASNNVHANPGFVNPGNHDYQLSLGSLCLAVVGYDTVAALGL